MDSIEQTGHTNITAALEALGFGDPVVCGPLCAVWAHPERPVRVTWEVLPWGATVTIETGRDNVAGWSVRLSRHTPIAGVVAVVGLALETGAAGAASERGG